MNDVLLTADMVKGWQREKATLEAEIESRQQKLAVINRQLEAVAVILKQDIGAEGASQATQQPDLIKVPAAILSVVGQATKPLTKLVIREQLEKAGYSQQRLLGTNYANFYTALGRLVKNKRLFQKGNGYEVAA